MDEPFAKAPISHDVKLHNFCRYHPQLGSNQVEGWMNKLSHVDNNK